MKNMKKVLLAILVATLLAGCAYLPAKTNLGQVAKDTGMKNITTGDGTFENYTATGYHEGTEVGIALGLPFIGKFMELYPVQSNEKLLEEVAKSAKEDGANAMINVTPHKEFYMGFPFFFLGIYVDSAKGTGIDVK